jgi:catechol 2,3-dioxygenase-like lactoylglutathione lyase family enzyme
MIKGLSHITLIVRDLERSAFMIQELLGAREIYDSSNKNYSVAREKFFDVAGLWLVLMEGPALPEKSYNHIAFQVEQAELPRIHAIAEQLGLEIKPPRSRIAGEGNSLYVYDYDNHLLEFHTGTLQQRLQAYHRNA